MGYDYLRIKNAEDFYAFVTRLDEFILLKRIQIICYFSKTDFKDRNSCLILFEMSVLFAGW